MGIGKSGEREKMVEKGEDKTGEENEGLRAWQVVVTMS